MKFSEQWLREWVDPAVDTTELAAQLTMAGLEVDTVTAAAGEFSKVVVGQVVSCDKHPDAKRLHVCKVNVGDAELVDIVCGGVNVRADLKVPVALVGAVLPGDFKIKKAKLRGQPSHGMICAARELGLSGGDDPQGGIMELRDDAPIGMDFREYLQLNDYVIDIELTPNRGDCASMLGVAREVALSNTIAYQPPALDAVPAQIDNVFPVKISAPNLCPRYVGRVIKNIDPTAKTPLWMQERLRRGGVRCLHPVVDVCNYVMLELGQPMHAFDLNTLIGGIEVRQAQAQEKITLLDGREIELNPDALVIADHEGPQALAGIMGGNDSAVIQTTCDIFLESAFFTAATINMTAKHFGVQSDSSYRFERGVDFQLQATAIERATALLLDIVGGEPGPVIDVAEATLPKQPTVALRRNQIQRWLGVTIDDQTVEQTLTALGMQLTATAQGWDVLAPSYRFDINLEVDLIEELARVYGYNQIQPQALAVELDMPKRSEQTIKLAKITDTLVNRGYHEAITYSFVDEEHQAWLDPEQAPIRLQNPIASDLAVMRTSLWPGLVAAAQYNQHRQTPRVRLFESGLCFTQVNDEWLQTPKLGLLAAGDILPEQWSAKARAVDFYDVKGDIEALLQLTYHATSFTWQPSKHPALHPGQSADLLQNGQIVGHLGALHPKIAQHFDFNHVPYLFEVVLTAMTSASLVRFQPISKFPATRRDLALLIDESVTAEALQSAIQQCAGDLLSRVMVFDVYQGQGIAEGKKSVAIGLIFRDPSRTLVDDEINEIIQHVVAVLERELNAQLRA